MKLCEIVEIKQLDEIKLRHAIAGIALGATVGASVIYNNNLDNIKAEKAREELSIQSKHGINSELEKSKIEIKKLLDVVLDKYKINPIEAKKIVELTKKHESSTFPKAKDILAVIGIESSFDPKAKSNLKHDKAIGLTQIRPKIWGLHPSDINGNIDKQIKISSEILNKYYKLLGNKEAAIEAYNIGITNLKHNKNLNPEYVNKWKSELKRYETI